LIGRSSASSSAQTGFLTPEQRGQRFSSELGTLKDLETELSRNIVNLRASIETLIAEISAIYTILSDTPSASDPAVKQASETLVTEKNEKTAKLNLKKTQLSDLKAELSGLQKEIRDIEHNLRSVSRAQVPLQTASPALVGPECKLAPEEKKSRRDSIKEAQAESFTLRGEILLLENTVSSLSRLVNVVTQVDIESTGELTPQHERILQDRNNLAQKRTELSDKQTRLRELTATVEQCQLELWKSSFAEKPGAWAAIHKAYGSTFNPFTGALAGLSSVAAGATAFAQLDIPFNRFATTNADIKAPVNGLLGMPFGMFGAIFLGFAGSAVLETTGAAGMMRAYSDLEKAARQQPRQPEVELTTL
jgi:predicted  nucleic acid-binding Zn-ribbon protein